ncbi:DNA-binding MarR family transcriptional regulator [Anaerospora hongkongensis]|uniref:DNA-binding MarR family transcriptional regulator n=1 Tax=Anaerospora hongkongensis TaxID=244830 RepID=A0A4R1QB63_9FIRM|nr:MarR family winged helix-turn-helix transcriptional regulator [Anaerospora hongkongensis]TCL40195.1 DNA-binding MarR family transcriptional regulator [Anaerospora hongkongensis]
MNDTSQIKTLRHDMRLLARKMELMTKGEASCCGITLTQCHLLTEIGWAGAASLNTLSERLGVDKSTMSRNIDILVNSNLVSRTIDPDNRRAVTITLTDEGNKLFMQVETSMTQFYETFYNALPADKRSQILESLELLLAAIPAGRWC